MSFPGQPTPHPHCPCYWLVVVFILFVLLISSLNFLPLLLIYLLTTYLENKLYLLQQILFSKIVIKNNVDTMSSGCIPTLLSSRMEMLVLTSLLFGSLAQKQCSFSLLLVTNRSQDKSAIERLIIHMSSATEWWTHALSVPAHLLCLVTVLVSLHMTFASLPQLPLAASICPPPLLAHTHTEDSLREEERHQMLAQVCKPCCCSTAVL